MNQITETNRLKFFIDHKTTWVWAHFVWKTYYFTCNFVWPIATGRLRKYTDNSVDELVCDVGYDVGYYTCLFEGQWRTTGNVWRTQM